MRLDVFQDRNLIRSYTVAVGLRRYRTPLGDFLLTQVTWNPWWYPPESDWARNEKVTPPGPGNPMGKVKLHIGGKLFLHGTPFTNSIGRAASHGCVRMRGEDAVALALLVQGATGVALADHDVSALQAEWSETRTVNLPVGIPVRLAYHLSEIRNGNLILHPDIYRLRSESAETEALITLARASEDTSRIDRAALRRLVRKARSDHVQHPVEQLILPRRPTQLRGFPDTTAEGGGSYFNDTMISRESQTGYGCEKEGT
jgi:murein L,D-transpeptidase YcbB/YkuD